MKKPQNGFTVRTSSWMRIQNFPVLVSRGADTSIGVTIVISSPEQIHNTQTEGNLHLTISDFWIRSTSCFQSSSNDNKDKISQIRNLRLKKLL